jgi:hypothetical protein
MRRWYPVRSSPAQIRLWGRDRDQWNYFTVVIAFTLAFSFRPALAAPYNWQCTFPGGENVGFVAELGSGRGKSITNIATADVLVHAGPGAVSFFEPLPTGAGILTTIVLKSGEASRSRNTVTSLESGAFLAVQVMGKCQVVPGL